MLTPFQNEPVTNFADPQERAAFAAALGQVQAECGRQYPLVIGGQHLMTEAVIRSTNPSHPDQVVGVTGKADRALAEQAMQAALTAYESWSRTDPQARARILLKAAANIRRRKHEFSATMVLEIGKNWAEADGDIAEAIDFLEFYSREMFRLNAEPHHTPFSGEENSVYYRPLGVGLVIPPWNFPAAICYGMTAAALVSGNTVILKPASITPVIAARFVAALEEAGLPPGVLNFLPGPGGEVGDYLVQHPQTRFISFTGSKEVGIRIFEQAARVQPGQKWLKRVIAEMGGKDAIVVDSDADLDEAAGHIITSAFGFQGQKCSACARVIAVAGVYDALLAKLKERTEALTVGDPVQPGINLGPVADAGAYKSILEYIEIGKGEGRLVAGGGPATAAGEGYFIQPTIIADLPPRARISCEEIFGPVVAVQKAATFAEAIALANDTEFGLTGGVMSRNREHLEYARREFQVGNLYFNRKITGALVDVQPFGGFNMSGTDSKAGGRDYLLLHTQMQSVTERF